MNRCKKARKRAGLTLDRAAEYLGIDPVRLVIVEDGADDPTPFEVVSMCDYYQVNQQWLLGTSELRDYETLKGIKGSENLTFHDRDVIAEFMASLPKK